MHPTPTTETWWNRPVDADLIRGVLNTTRVAFLSAAVALASGFLFGLAALAAASNTMPLWLLARSAGITSYLLLTGVTALGMILSHNTRARHRPHPDRIRLHLAAVTFTFAFTALHVAVLVLDPYAHVGLLGALLPFGAAYRPVPVTLGLVSVWAALAAGLSAGLAGRGTGRLWLYLHRFAASSWTFAWLHAVLTGVDTPALTGMYLLTGTGIVGLGVWRYLTRERAVIDAQRDRMAVTVR